MKLFAFYTPSSQSGSGSFDGGEAVAAASGDGEEVEVVPHHAAPDHEEVLSDHEDVLSVSAASVAGAPTAEAASSGEEEATVDDGATFDDVELEQSASSKTERTSNNSFEAATTYEESFEAATYESPTYDETVQEFSSKETVSHDEEATYDESVEAFSSKETVSEDATYEEEETYVTDATPTYETIEEDGTYATEATNTAETTVSKETAETAPVEEHARAEESMYETAPDESIEVSSEDFNPPSPVVEAKVPAAASDVSEMSHASTHPSTDVASEGVAADKSFDSQASASSTVSNKLEDMMIDRISAIDNIRALLEREMEQDNGLLAEFTDKVVVLEGQLGEKNGCIGMLEREVDGLKRKNGDYARELTNLTETINQLVDSNTESNEKMVGLEQTIASQKEVIEEMTEETKEKMAILDKNVVENDRLSAQLKASKEAEGRLEALVDGLQSQNADYTQKIQNLVASLDELVEQNKDLEARTGDLVSQNQRLEQREADTKASVERMAEEHKATVASWEKKLTDEAQAGKLLREEMVDLRARMGEEAQDKAAAHAAKALLEAKVTTLEGSLAESKLVVEREAQRAEALQADLADAKRLRREEAESAEKLKVEIEGVRKGAAEAVEKTESTVAILEKGLEDEFAISKKLKKNLEETKKKYQQENAAVEKLKASEEELKVSAKAAAKKHNQETLELSKAIEMLDGKIEKLSQSLSESKAACEGEVQKNEALAKDLTVAKAQLEEAQQTTIKIAERQAATEAKLEKTKATHKQERARLAEDLTKAADTIGKLNKKTAAQEQLKKELQELREQLLEEKSNTETMKGLQDRLEETEKRLVEARTEVVASKETQTEMLGRVGKLLDKIEEKDAQVRKLTAEKETVQGYYDEMSAMNQKLSVKMEESKDETANTLAELQKRLRDTEDDASSVRAEKTSLDKLIEQMELEKKSLSSKLDEAKKEQSRESKAWKDERRELKKRMKEADRTLVMLSQKNEKVSESASESEKKHLKAMAKMQAQLQELQEEKTALAETVVQLQSDQQTIQSDLTESKTWLEERDALAAQLQQAAKEKDGLQRSVDDLHRFNDDLISQLEETKSLKSKESGDWNQEKKRLTEEKARLKKKLKESDRTLITLAKQKGELESQKTGLERQLSTNLIETKGKHSKTIADLQVRLQDTERHLSRVISEKDILEETVTDLQQICLSKSLEATESNPPPVSERSELSDLRERLRSQINFEALEVKGNKENAKTPKRSGRKSLPLFSSEALSPCAPKPLRLIEGPGLVRSEAASEPHRIGDEHLQWHRERS